MGVLGVLRDLVEKENGWPMGLGLCHHLSGA